MTEFDELCRKSGVTDDVIADVLKIPLETLKKYRSGESEPPAGIMAKMRVLPLSVKVVMAAEKGHNARA